MIASVTPVCGGVTIAAALICPGVVFASPPTTAARPQPAAVVAGERADDVVHEGPREDATRVVVITSVELVGREQVGRRQIEGILASEGLVAGAEVVFPSDERVERARALLVATGYFRRVTLKLVPVRDDAERPTQTSDEDTTPPPPSVAPDPSEQRFTAKLVVQVSERPSVEIPQVYLGTSWLTPFRGGVEAVERNFLGRSMHIGGGVVWGSLPRHVASANRQQAYEFRFEAPRLGTRPVGIATKVYVTSAAEPYRVAGAWSDPDPRNFRLVDYKRVGGVFGLTFPVLPTFRLGLDYRFEGVDARLPDDPTFVTESGELRPIDLELRRGWHRLASMDASLRWDGRSMLRRAGQGGRVALDLSLSSPAIGSQYEYAKVIVGGAYTFRLPWGHWITPSATGGQVVGRAPRFERFYAGDLSAWTPGRELGLIYSTRTPIDVFGTGVDAQPFASIVGRVDLEYAIPLFRTTRLRFVDAGHFFFSIGTYALAGKPEERRIRRADGLPAAGVGFNADLGLRIDTRIGPIVISVGNVLRRTPL